MRYVLAVALVLTSLTAPFASAGTRPSVEIVFAIDTTGSMSGLIDGAKRRIWGIVNEIMRSPCKPEVRIGLVAYRDRGDDYQTKLLPLTTDLDLVYETLMAYDANGGGDTPENVRRALAEAESKMGWSPQAPDLAQIIFLVGDAPPHDDYDNEPETGETASRAARRGIVVHAIQCGGGGETKAAWEAIAKTGAGSYFEVPLGQAVARVERTPYDAPLADLGRQIGETYLPYGSTSDQEAAAARQAAVERAVRRGATRSTAADRAINKAVNSLAYEGDFLQAIENGTLKLDEVPAAQLPEDLRGLVPADLKAEVARRIARRQSLRASILDLMQLRDTFLDRKAEGATDDGSRFDGTVGDAVKQHLKQKGIECP